MDGSQFDSWTRRTFGLAVGGGVAAALGLSQLDDAAAKKKKKGKNKGRCKKFDTGCNPTGKKCCPGLACEEGNTGGNRCCKKLGTKCTDGSECCNTGICDNVVPGGDPVCCNLEENFCEKDQDCCEGFTCNEANNKCELEV